MPALTCLTLFVKGNKNTNYNGKKGQYTKSFKWTMVLPVFNNSLNTFNEML